MSSASPTGRRAAAWRFSEPAIKRAARELGVEVHQPLKVKTGNLDQWLLERAIDVAVVLAYGRILPEPRAFGAAPRLHESARVAACPKYRGAAPIQWAIAGGETRNGDLADADGRRARHRPGVHRAQRFRSAPTRRRGSSQHGSQSSRPTWCAKTCPVQFAGELRADAARRRTGQPGAADRTRARAPRLVGDRRRRSTGSSARMTPRPGAHTSVRGKALKILKARAARPRLRCRPRAPWRSLRVASSASRPARERSRFCEPSSKAERRSDAVDLINGRVLKSGDVLG